MSIWNHCIDIVLLLFCVVPNFHISPDVAGGTDEEMQKTIVHNKKLYSFSSYCKNLVGIKDKRNNKSIDSEVRNITRMCFSMHSHHLKLQIKQAVTVLRFDRFLKEEAAPGSYWM